MLIALFALSVIAGTIIESLSASHKLASRLIYSHPFFLAILWGVFVNILFATLKRYPFKRGHIPFIITHIGLLMVIGGTLLKISFGLQGSLTLKEGDVVKEFFLDDSRAISIRDKGSDTWKQTPLKTSLLGRLKTSYPDFNIKGYAPHGDELFEGWIKGDKLVILGLAPLPLNLSGKWEDKTLLALEDAEKVKSLLEKLPALIFFKEKEGGELVLDIDAEGNIASTSFPKGIFPRLYAYDDGFKGYTLPLKLQDKELETPLTRQFTPLPLPKKAEEERPLISIAYGKHAIPLAFNSQLPTPIPEEDKLIRFEAERSPLPKLLKLKKAWTEFYPNSTKPKNYHAKLFWYTEVVELSMNQVWESEEGYRFYLANIQDKEVRLVVNRDPFKHLLTYPGAIILALGIGLLFFKGFKRSG